jgi:hypothetical protein
MYQYRAAASIEFYYCTYFVESTLPVLVDSKEKYRYILFRVLAENLIAILSSMLGARGHTIGIIYYSI